MSNILISLAAEFVGKKAFSDASKSTVSLEKQVKKLGKTLGLALSTAAIVAYGKASVKAFAADEAAAQRLATAIDNLGLSFANAEVATFISDLEKSASVADDQLRPAFQALLTTTGSLTQSQKLLNLAIETSRGTGIELTTVAKDLSMAYVGNTRGLRKYNLGLTQAELKTASFATVQAKLNEQFKGANAAYLDTSAGKLTAISLAFDRLQESVGGALIDSFSALSGDSGVQGFIDRIDILGEKIIKAGQEFQVFALITKGLFTLKNGDEIERQVRELRRSFQYEGAKAFEIGNNAVTGFDKDEAAKKKAEAEAAKRAKELANLTKQQVKAQKALTAEQKKQALAKKQSALFDLEQIQLVAALQGKLSKEEQDRVKLQLALLTGNTAEADKLSQKIAMSIDSTGALARSLKDLPDANNPFKNWDAYLDTILVKAKEVARLGSGGGGTGGGTGGLTTVQTNAVSTTVFNSIGSANASTRTADEAARLYGGMGPSKIVVQIDGKEIASAVQTQSLTGNNPIVNRLLGGFA